MEITYRLHNSQYQVFNDPSRFIVLAAGRRFGKTVLAVIKLFTVAIEKPNMRCWYIAPYYKQAKNIAWDMMLRLIPKEIILSKNETNLEVRLINGSEISLKGADNEDSLVGVGLNFVVMDEFALQKPNIWEKIVRPMLTDTLGKALFISTPRGKNHFWELFVKGEKKELGYSSYRFGTVDNPYIERSEIKEAQSQLNDRYFKQEYEASFEDYAGLIYPEFDQKSMVIEPFEIPSNYNTLGAIDPAVTGTFASLFCAIDGDGTLFITGEYYQLNQRVDAVCSSIRGKAERWIMDPAGKIMRSNSAGSLFNFFDEFRDQGIHPWPAHNAVMAGINHTAQYFKNGKIKIFNTCKNLIHELERYHWSEERETSQGIVDPKPYKALDHLCDCLRYLVMSRIEKSEPLEKVIVHSADWWEKQAEEQENFRIELERMHND